MIWIGWKPYLHSKWSSIQILTIHSVCLSGHFLSSRPLALIRYLCLQDPEMIRPRNTRSARNEHQPHSVCGRPKEHGGGEAAPFGKFHLVLIVWRRRSHETPLCFFRRHSREMPPSKFKWINPITNKGTLLDVQWRHAIYAGIYFIIMH